jgi:hypothetical protein
MHEGNKNFELRKNDRNYQVGDTLILREFWPLDQKYTGNILTMKVQHMLKGGNFGVQKDFVVMSGEIKK